MRVLTTTSRFDRMLVKFIRSHPDLRDVVHSVIKNLVQSSHNPKLKTHTLGGRLKGTHGASINSKYRIIFLLSDDEICLIGIGSHDEVY